MKLLFDATELSYYLDKSGHRAGVFFVALNLFRELKKRGIDLVFVCNFKRYYFLKEVLSKVDEFKGIKLQTRFLFKYSSIVIVLIFVFRFCSR